MANTKIIKQKIKAITSIKKITKTMEMVAVSKMKKSVKETLDMSEYISELKFIINNIKNESFENHIFFTTPDRVGGVKNEAEELVIIFGSNKGLAGSFNSNIYKATKKLIDNNPNIKQAICFGKFAEKVARKLNLEIKLSYLEIEKINKVSQVYKIEKFVREMYVNKNIQKVHAVYTNFIKMGLYQATGVTLYPVDKNLNIYNDVLEEKINDVKKSKQIYTFEPNLNSLIETVIPKIIRTILLSYVLESRASENSSRSFAMKRASESAGEILGDLKIKYNKVRQDGITAEIAEISAGANS